MSIQEDLKAYLDGELPADQAEEVRSAIDKDPQLRGEVEILRLLGASVAVMAPHIEIKGAQATLNAVRFTPSRRLDVGRWLLALSGAAVLLVAAFVIPKLAAPREDVSATIPVRDAVSITGPVHARQPVSEDRLSGFSRVDKSRISPTATETPAPVAGASEGMVGALPSQPEKQSKLITPNATKSGRQIIQNADLGITVDSPSKAESDAIALAKSNGGFAQNSSMDNMAQDQPVAQVTLRVPVDRFGTVVKQLKGYGKVQTDHVTGEDVTGQIADTDARIKALEASDESYILMLRGSRRVSDSLEIRSRLDEVRQELESLRAQSATLKEQAAMSTINVTFSSKPKEIHPGLVQAPNDWAKDTWTSAANGFGDLCRAIAQGAIFIFVYSPLWIPIFALMLWTTRRVQAR